jgi:hypothetical protein
MTALRPHRAITPTVRETVLDGVASDGGTGCRQTLEIHMELSRTQSMASWVLQVAVGLILFQTLFFKFTGAEESKYIFSRLGLEPWGRIGSGVVELVAVLLLMHPRTAVLGAILALGVISGAIISHLTRLGVVVKDDGGLLFGLAVAVFVGSAAILVIRRAQIPYLGPRVAGRMGSEVSR